jgi:hypothetical protein
MGGARPLFPLDVVMAWRRTTRPYYYYYYYYCASINYIYIYIYMTDESLPVLLTQYCSGDKIEMNEIGGACRARGRGQHGERRGVYRVLVGKPEGKRPPERPRRRWEDNIKMDLQEVGCDGMGWIDLAQDRDRWRAK